MLSLIIVGSVLGYLFIGACAARWMRTSTHNEYKDLKGKTVEQENKLWPLYSNYRWVDVDVYKREMNRATEISLCLLFFWPPMMLFFGAEAFVSGGVNKAIEQDKRNEDAIKFLKNQAKSGSVLERENAKELLAIMEK